MAGHEEFYQLSEIASSIARCVRLPFWCSTNWILACNQESTRISRYVALTTPLFPPTGQWFALVHGFSPPPLMANFRYEDKSLYLNWG
jgi:hypothetical protein